MQNTLLNQYEKQCQSGLIQSDLRQITAIAHLQRIFDDLMCAPVRRSLLHRIRKRRQIRGLYMYGGVGIGKTFLMDLFFHQLPFHQKWRLHFHAFMQFIHHELKALQGKKDPLKILAKELAKRYRVICFDEFIVNDIVDAMLLKNLLEALFSQGVCFVATSNTAPDDLYKHGLQRSAFIPAIALLKEHLEIIHLDSSQDYRLLQIRKSGVYFTPDNYDAHNKMERIFSMLVHDDDISVDPITINDRPINIIKCTSDIIWFDFNEICRVPRSQHDYLEIAKQYKIIFVSHIPVLPKDAKNTLTLFIKMIDVFYDAGIVVIFSAENAAELLGINNRHAADFARTESRMMEMQSEKYFSAKLSGVASF